MCTNTVMRNIPKQHKTFLKFMLMYGQSKAAQRISSQKLTET